MKPVAGVDQNVLWIYGGSESDSKEGGQMVGFVCTGSGRTVMVFRKEGGRDEIKDFTTKGIHVRLRSKSETQRDWY